MERRQRQFLHWRLDRGHTLTWDSRGGPAKETLFPPSHHAIERRGCIASSLKMAGIVNAVGVFFTYRLLKAGIYLFEHNLLPDFLSRWGMRRLLSTNLISMVRSPEPRSMILCNVPATSHMPSSIKRTCRGAPPVRAAGRTVLQPDEQLALPEHRKGEDKVHRLRRIP